MKRIAALFLALTFTLPAAAATNGELEAAKQRLTTHLETTLATSTKELAAFEQSIKSGKPLELAIDPRQLLKHGRAQQKSLQNFLASVKTAAPATLPARLVSDRQACSKGTCAGAIEQSSFEDALAAYGAPLLEAMESAWPQTGEYMREAFVYLSGRLSPIECRQDWLDGALGDSHYRVRFAALHMFKNTCDTSNFLLRLDNQLEQPHTPDELLALLELGGNNSPQSATYRRKLVELTEAGRVPLDQAWSQLCTLPAPTLDLAFRPLNAPFWLKAYQDNPQRRMCLVGGLFAQLRNRETLELLTPVLNDAANHLYGFYDTQTLYERTQPESLRIWDSAPGSDIAILSAFRNNLPVSTWQSWYDQPDMTLGSKMLLGYWLGKNLPDSLPSPLFLSLVISDASGKTVSQTEQPLKLNEFFEFTTPAADNFPAIKYSGTLQFDGGQLGYKLAGFHVGLQPAAAAFEAAIPLLGKFIAELNMAGHPYRWTLRVNTAANPVIPR